MRLGWLVLGTMAMACGGGGGVPILGDADVGLDDGDVEDGAIDDGGMPDGALDGAFPDGAFPDGAFPDGALPDGSVPDAAPDAADASTDSATDAGDACVPTSERCNSADDDCDGMTDEDFSSLGDACDGSDADLCDEGVLICNADGTSVVCDDASGDTPELCNSTDDDCDGSTDEGLGLGATCDGADSDLCEEGMIVCDGSGGTTCSDTSSDTLEVCNGMDDDCDGVADEGDPGGGVSCGDALGECRTLTSCEGGTLVCRGTFVSPNGGPTSEGTQSDPLDSINDAIANAMIIGGGADVCVCDPVGGGESVFSENVTMVEGVSILGGYACGTWTRDIVGRGTRIQNQDRDGVLFGAAVTDVTSLDGMRVTGLRVAAGRSAAITLEDSAGRLVDVSAQSGAAPEAVALHVREIAGAAAPSVLRGSYNATALAGGVAMGARLDGGSTAIDQATFSSSAASDGMRPDDAYGVWCDGCAGTTATAMNANGGSANDVVTGFYATGEVDGLAISASTMFGGNSPVGGTTQLRGVHLDTCFGSVAIDASQTFGGGSNAPGSTRHGVLATGASCDLRVDGGSHIGCEFSGTCTGIRCVGAPCSVSNASLRGSGGPARNVTGLACDGGCSLVSDNTIRAGNLDGSGSLGIGLHLLRTSPEVDDNVIFGPGGGAGVAPPPGSYAGLWMQLCNSYVSNNVVTDAGWAGRTEMVHYESFSPGPIAAEMTLHSNTIEYESCVSCGARVGIYVQGAGPAGGVAFGIVRNNIVRNTGGGGATVPVAEADAFSDFNAFENNDLFDPTASVVGVYLDEGTTPLSIMGVNMLAGAAANFSADCLLDATWHLGAGSMCIDAGTSVGAPAIDFDDEARPVGIGHDVGADELTP